MRHGSTGRRMRHRGGNGGSPGQQQQSQQGQGNRRGFQSKNRVFDSNGPEVRIRGTAFQIVDKYSALAKDAHSAGDRVLAESYLQHAEHYQRMVNAWNEEFGMDEQPVSDAGYTIPPPAGTDSQPAQQRDEDDLGLPASIIGAKPISQPTEEIA